METSSKKPAAGALRAGCLNFTELSAISVANIGPTLVAALVVPLMYASAGNASFVYYSTPTRAAELVAGALLATSTRVPRWISSRASPLTTLLGFFALGIIVTLCATASITDGWLTAGGLSAFRGSLR